MQTIKMLRTTTLHSE